MMMIVVVVVIITAAVVVLVDSLLLLLLLLLEALLELILSFLLFCIRLHVESDKEGKEHDTNGETSN